MIYILLLMIHQAIACTELPKKSETETKIFNVQFDKDITKKFCLHLPMPKNSTGNILVEAKTVNKANSSCGNLVLKMVRPNKNDISGNMSKTKYKSYGPQPGGVLMYTVGKWVLKYTMTTNLPNCSKWDLGVTWSLK